MLLKYGLGEEKAIKRIEVAVLVALKNGFRTGDVYYVGTDDCMSNAFYFRCSVDLVQPCPTEQPTCPFCLGLMTSNSRLSSATMYTTTTITTITTTTSTTISTVIRRPITIALAMIIAKKHHHPIMIITWKT